jgi:SNF2 family DNA or RNA helicase
MTAAEFIAEYLHQFKTPPRQHQIVGVECFLTKKAFGNLDEMGSGKSKQVIDAGCLLYKAGNIQVMLVVTPASIRRNWLDKNYGEIQKHCWLPHVAYEFHSKGLVRVYETTPDKPRLVWIVTNYEFIRQKHHRDNLLKILKGKKVWIVADESSYISSYKSAQTKAAIEVRDHCDRAAILNGTPVGNSPETLFSQMKFLDSRIIGLQYITHFRARYCVMEDVRKKDPKDRKVKVQLIKGTNVKIQRIAGYQNMEELQRKIKPYVIRRLKEDCLDLPPLVDVSVPVTLSQSTWDLYKQMRDEAIAILPDEEVSLALHAITKIMRLDQLCSGLLGGVENDLEPKAEKETRIISSEKHDYMVDFLEDHLKAYPDFRLIVWTRFRKEQEILRDKILARKLSTRIHRIYGGQRDDERDAARIEMKAGSGPVVLLGQPQAGGIGLDFSTTSYSMYISQDYNLLTRLQSRDRPHRIGQKAEKVTNYDLIAVGPRGEKTINHAIVGALQRKESIASWTTSAWRAAIAAM